MFTFADGRRCRTPRTRKNPHFCFDHAQKEARARARQSLGKDRAEGVDVFLLGDVDGLQEGLGQVGDGAGGSGFYITAEDGGDEAAQSGAEIASGEVVAGEEAQPPASPSACPEQGRRVNPREPNRDAPWLNWSDQNHIRPDSKLL